MAGAGADEQVNGQVSGGGSGSDPGLAGRLREMLGELEVIERPSASEGEREAATWIAGKLGELGLDARPLGFKNGVVG